MTRLRRWALMGGTAAGPVFLIISAIDGATRDGYSARKHPISSLALGPRGRIQTANFAVTGLLYLAGTQALRRCVQRPNATGLAAIIAASAGICTAALFATDRSTGIRPAVQ